MQLEAFVAFQLQLVAERVLFGVARFGIDEHVVHVKWRFASDRCSCENF